MLDGPCAHYLQLPVICSISQGSMLDRPILYISYTNGVTSVFHKHQVNHHLYHESVDMRQCQTSFEGSACATS